MHLNVCTDMRCINVRKLHNHLHPAAYGSIVPSFQEFSGNQSQIN